MKNRYLDWIEKNAANAFTKKYRDGNLSPGSLTRIQGAGMVRGPEQMAAGINRGSENILKKEAPGFSIYEDPYDAPPHGLRNIKARFLTRSRINMGGYASAPNPFKKVLVPKHKNMASLLFSKHNPQARFFLKEDRTHLENGSNLLDSILRRHEVYEASEMNRKSYKKGGTIITHFHDPLTSKVTGRHANLGVIGRESNLVSSIVPGDRKEDIRGTLQRMRARTGEGKTKAWESSTKGSPYGYGHLSNRVIKKMRNFPPNSTERVGFLTGLLAGRLKGGIIAHM